MKKLIFVCLMAIVGMASSHAQLAKMQALYLLQFAKNTSWPKEDSGKPFVFTIVGDKALAEELKSIAGAKTVGNRQIEVEETPVINGLGKSDVIFLGASKSSQMHTLVSLQSKNTVLIVSGAKGMCAAGAGISFLPDKDKLNFEIHEGNIARNGLKVTQKIVSLAKQVF